MLSKHLFFIIKIKLRLVKFWSEPEQHVYFYCLHLVRVQNAILLNSASHYGGKHAVNARCTILQQPKARSLAVPLVMNIVQMWQHRATFILPLELAAAEWEVIIMWQTNCRPPETTRRGRRMVWKFHKGHSPHGYPVMTQCQTRCPLHSCALTPLRGSIPMWGGAYPQLATPVLIKLTGWPLSGRLSLYSTTKGWSVCQDPTPPEVTGHLTPPNRRTDFCNSSLAKKQKWWQQH